MPVARRVSPTADLLARLIVTILLLAMAAEALRRGEYEAFAGGVTGGVIAHWLPGAFTRPSKEDASANG